MEREEAADSKRIFGDGPEPEAVFSQVRNGRTKRVEESLNAGFPVDAEDEKGNTCSSSPASRSTSALWKCSSFVGPT